MKKITALLLIMALCLAAVFGFAVAAEKTETWRYIHDPAQNLNAMKDIVVNPDAVYGFSPDPESTRLGAYAEYDWTDPVWVAEAQESRREYHKSMESMMDILYRMRDEGATLEEMARAVSTERNVLRLASYKDDPEGLKKLKASNLETYGHEEGPTPDELFEKYGSWQAVLQKAFSPNLGMDAACGLYDENYDLYVELGLAEPDPDPADPAEENGGDSTATDAPQDYILHVVDQYGDPVPGLYVNFCTDSACTMAVSDGNGTIVFSGAQDVYHVQMLRAPDGYSFDSEFELYTGREYGEWRLCIRKN